MIDDLRSMCDGTRMLKVEWDMIPAPPHAEFQGEHLFINVSYGEPIVRLVANSMLNEIEIDIAAILHAVREDRLGHHCRSVCISFFGDPGSGPIRVLRFSIPQEDLMSGVFEGTIRSVQGRLNCMITSDMPEMEALLEEN